MHRKSTTLYCFSPPVMLATFVVEIALLCLFIVKSGLKSPAKLTIATMLLLIALFQLSEYFVCGGMGFNAEAWSRIGFVVITFLPILGLSLVYLLQSSKKGFWKVILALSWASALVWTGYFVASSRVFDSYQCSGNYAVFLLSPPYDSFYFIYYYGWLLLAIVLMFLALRSANEKRRRKLRWLMIGYGTFMIPTGIVNLVKPETIQAIPSIMCGFAVVFAFVLVFGVQGINLKPKQIDN